MLLVIWLQVLVQVVVHPVVHLASCDDAPGVLSDFGST